MTKLNHFHSISSLLLTAAIGVTLGACDPKMIGAESEGDVACKDGETMPAEDGCNDCVCMNGEWTCTEKACNDEGPPDACVDGEVKPAGDGCNQCSCYEGAWACTELGCDGGGGCGDGIVGGAEACDDGNKVDDDACPNDCGVGGQTGTAGTDTGDVETTSTSGTDTGDVETTSMSGTDTGGGVCGDGIVEASESCDDGNAVDDDGCPNDCGLGDVCGPKDPLTIDGATIEGDALKVNVTYGGGCEAHVIDMCWNGVFAESFPVQTWIELSHESNGDLCKALVMEVITLDLAGMKTAYQEGYQTQNGTITIQLDGWPSALDYTF